MASSWVQKTLEEGSKKDVRALFAFNADDSDETVLFKFRLWSRWFFPKFFHVADAAFHEEIDRNNLAVYRGTQPIFVDIAFRGAAKTTRTKLFFAFCISNDLENRHRYIKHNTEDYPNAKQNVTDVYNMLNSKRIHDYWPEIFEKTTQKREETMSSFTTSTGIKMRADSVGMGQRGDIQDDARPSLLWFEDFENRKVLRSAVTLQSIWDNMEEAYNGLARHGGAIYNCNYLSERGNVHKLVTKYPQYTLVTPIKGKVEDGVFKDGEPTWPSAYTSEQVETKLANADDPAGEYLCVPSAGADVFFDRESVNKQEILIPIREIAGFKIFHEYDPSHRYGSGHDVGGGVELDHSTSVFIDFSTIPSRVVATYKNNTVKPDSFGDEIQHQADRFGEPLIAVENNKFDMCIGRLKQIYSNLYCMKEGSAKKIKPSKETQFGWNTNSDTKPKMLYALKKAVEDGHLELSDPDLVKELRSYTRDDLMDRDEDVRLTTRHFDLLIAAAIAYQMKDWAEPATVNARTLQNEQMGINHHRQPLNSGK